MPLHSVRVKILLGLAAGTLFFAVAMVLFTQTVVRRRLEALLQEKGVAIARKIASDSVNAVITERYFEIEMMFKDLQGTESDMVYAYIVGEDGRDLVGTFGGAVPPALKRAHAVDASQPYAARELATDQGQVLDIGVPLLRGQIGVLHLGLSLAPIHGSVNRFVQLILAFAALVLLSGGAGAVAYARVVTRPLERLAESAESFGRGETNRPVPIESEDEVGQLAQVFNEMVENRVRIEQERERLIGELRKSLSEVKTLRGFLPICSSCKKIRGDQGYWQQIESYIREHSEAEFSHGICPECARELYPEIWEKMHSTRREEAKK